MTLLWRLTTVDVPSDNGGAGDTSGLDAIESHTDTGSPSPEDSHTRRDSAPVVRKVAAPGSAINVLLVVVDTERADATGPHGATLPTTPFFSELAREGVVFTNAFSTAPWTVPAMYSMITGLYPSEHGVDHGAAGALKRKGIGVIGQSPLPEAAVTLAEMLKQNGYSTFGVNTNLHLSRPFGFAQGFDHFVGEKFEFLPFPNVALETLIPVIRVQSKYFLWLHYFDPHLPYYTDGSLWFPQWNTTGIPTFPQLAFDLVLKDYRKTKKLDDDALVAPRDIPSLFRDWQSLVPKVFSRPDSWFKPFKPLKERHKEFFRTAYLSNIRKVDDAMAAAFAKLSVDNQALVIITSDHGEELFERGRLGHHHAPYWSLYQELLHVPLVILFPGGEHAGTVVDAPVSILDIVPTILDVLEAKMSEPMSGQSLLPLLEGSGDTDRSLFAEVSYPRAQGRALIQYPWKYIYAMKNQKGKLFNLKTDPGERRNLVRNEPKRASEMRARLLEYIRNTKPRWPIKGYSELSSEEIQQLRTLGYMN